MKIKPILKSLIIILASVGCKSISKTQYDEAYKIMNKDFLSKVVSVQEFGRDISGIYIYDSVYPNPLNGKDDNNIYRNILSEKKAIKPIKKARNLKNYLSSI